MTTNSTHLRPRLNEQKIKLLILIPTRGTMRTSLVKWLWQVIPRAPFMVKWDTVEDGRPEDDARNKAVKRFLEAPEGYTHLMMIDDDISPPANALGMVLHDKPIVSAVVFTWKDKQPLALVMEKVESLGGGVGKKQRTPSSYRADELKGDKGGYRQDTEAITKLNSGQRLVSVDASGTGCFVVKREVYENLVSNWFRFQYDNTGILTSGEDFAFYDKIRAMGYTVYVDGAVVCGHYGVVDIKEIQDFLSKQK